jgi:hypothetical protein
MKYTVKVTQTKIYEIEVDAIDEDSAISSLDEFIDDDFQEYITGNSYTMEVK